MCVAICVCCYLCVLLSVCVSICVCCYLCALHRALCMQCAQVSLCAPLRHLYVVRGGISAQRTHTHTYTCTYTHTHETRARIYTLKWIILNTGAVLAGNPHRDASSLCRVRGGDARVHARILASNSSMHAFFPPHPRTDSLCAPPQPPTPRHTPTNSQFEA